jgi:DNA-binding MarR family transcriptional regulator
MKKKSTRAAVELMARECVGNQLRLLDRVVTSVYEEELRPLKLTPSQMIILAITTQQGRVRAVELSRLLQMDASTVSRNVERLRARGWIEEASGKDSRSRPFQLTSGGEKVLEDAIVAWERAQAKAVDLLGKEGVILLRRTTKNVRAKASAD